MKSMRVWILLATLALAGAIAGAQDYRDEDSPRRRPRHRDNQAPVFLLNEQIIDLAIDRIADEMGKHYEFDEDQLWNVRESIKDRFPRFIMENRDEIVTVMNQYTMAMLGADPPDAEDVATWSQNTLPLINQFADLVRETAADIEPILTEEQILKMDAEMAAFDVGLNHLNNKMAIWSDGGYNWESEWPRSEAFREKNRAEKDALHAQQDAARAEVLGIEPSAAGPVGPAGEDSGGSPPPAADTPGPTSRPHKDRPPDEWSAYVDAFIKRYQLDEGQQSAARRILRTLQDQRDQYMRRHKSKLEEVEQHRAAATTDEAREKVADEARRLQEPIDRMFENLKERLDKLPTRKQRQEAAAKDAAHDAIKTRATAESKPAPEQAGEIPPAP